MKTVLVCNQKGGVGKTLISDELAFALERDEIKFNLYDMDQQGGLIHQMEDVEDAVVQVVDTPGALQEKIKKWMESADFIVIPTKMSNRDIEPLITTLDIYESLPNKIPALVVFNEWRKTNNSKEFIDWFERSYPDMSTAILSLTTDFLDAGARQISIEDYKARSIGAKQIREIYTIIKHELKLKEGYR